MKNHPRLVGLKEVSEILGVSTTSLRETLARNDVYFQVVGGRKIFFYDDIVEFQKKRLEQAKHDKRIRLK